MEFLLPEITNRERYKELFSVSSYWEPAIEHLVKKHHLKGEVRRGTLGSHIVYRVGDCWLKLMAPIFAKDMAFELSGLKAVNDRLSVKTPKVIATGVLEDWPYVIVDHIDGEPIRNVWSKLNLKQQTHLADQIGVLATEISKCSVDEIIEKRFSWNDFILQQYQECDEQQLKKGLPKPWRDHIKSFLHSFDISEFQTSNQVFLHADLTYDHFLVTGAESLQISGIIDMADCQVGHFEYELVAPAVFIFKGNHHLLLHFLRRCGIAIEKLNSRFSEKLLAWSIMHRYFSMISYFQDELNSCAPGDFRSLAKKVFPL